MMGQCKVCPGRQGLVDYLDQWDDLRDTEEITYKQWVSTDCIQLAKVVVSTTKTLN